ncbi:Inner membrane transport permease YbhS [Novipirellula aureliae]|uniref:Inner membrane transport permease YbhS n=1 Tax=Novipirellula aureliae TaxID=2527966 RepID=A0A5C6DDB1_9BACT|nr:ABC transporter permease [Novipirellula aureliae]TWU35223.1 Inner membrane transport permease YbhS [Novipirellula aureliae]
MHVPTRSNIPSRGGSLMRLRGLVRKEFLQVIRDPSSLAIAFVLPVILLLMFGYGVSLDSEHVPIAIVVEKPTADTASLCAELEHSLYFDSIYSSGMPAAKQAMMERRVDAILHLRENFSEQLRRPEGASVQLIVNGVDANTARIVQGYVAGAFGKWLVHYSTDKGQTSVTPVNLEQRIWFNANVQSRNYLVPGVVAVVMTLIGALLTALLMAREWERGTMEALMVTPVSMQEILVGKILPYFILGMGGLALSVLMGVWLFGVPLRGSIAVLIAGSSLFLLTALGMGLLISTVTRVQFVAAQVAIITTYLPAFILSGFIFDIGSMPWPIQWLTHLIPARYYVAILKTSFLAGDVWSVLLPNSAALAVMATVFLGLTRLLSRKCLD